MEENLELVFSTDQSYQIEIAKELLEENDIESFVLNQHDSMIPTIGTVELYVKKEDIVKAEEILKKLKS